MAIPERLHARWRPSVLALLVMAVGCLLFAAAAIGCVIGLVNDPGSAGPWAMLVSLYASMSAVCGLATRARIDLYDDHVVLLRWFGFQTTSLRLADVAHVGTDGFGLDFVLRDGRRISGPANVGEKGLGLKLLGYRNRGDRIAERIMATADRTA